MSQTEPIDIDENSYNVLMHFGRDIQLVEGYVADDKFTCVYEAPNEDRV